VYSIYNGMTIRGCTFYGNRSTAQIGRGGAVYFYGPEKTLTLTGNLFYGNAATNEYPVVWNYNSSGTITASYNVVDTAFGTGDTQCGWNGGTGDTTFTALSITGDPFDTTSFVPVSGLQNILPSPAPAGFPATDFYGSNRTTRVPGAVNYSAP
jgi:hypothetical protein